jgi:Lon protease-like protein
MPDLLPVFPLPNVVLFPNVFLPLHIFEARYREMVADALASDRVIGMVLLRPGWERDGARGPRERERASESERGWGPASGEDAGQPPAVYSIGCSGVMTHAERLPDGRYNIVLRGLERFRILDEDRTRSYRRAVVELLVERPLAPDDRAAVRSQRAKLEALVGPALRQAQDARGESAADPRPAAAMGDEDLVNALAQYLELEPLEKQALLEHDSLRTRAEALVELLEMKIIMARTPGLSNVAH